MQALADIGGCMGDEKRVGTHDVVDMEVECVQCHARLYVSVTQAHAVMASLTSTGAAILICLCGQAQLICSPRLPRHD